MSCVEKRHMSHRAGSMLHHRFPNGFTDFFMDETDREVSTLTDRAFRSLCIGDDAVYNDEFSYGYSPFSCHKPLVGEPVKKTIKESRKHGQSRRDKNETQPWKQQQQKNMSQMSSFLKALSATEDSCGGMFQKNGVVDSNGESWDKSALRSIQRELSEFSTDYHTNLTDGPYKKQPSGDVSSNKMGKDHSSGKSSKSKNGKTNVKIKKLNIKNFFLHSDLSPFQAWKDLNRFHFAQERIVASILPEDPVPKWYDLSFYKELTEAHMKESLQTEEADPCQKAVVKPPPPPPRPPAEPKPIPPPVPPKVLPKPLLTLTAAEKRCLSEGGDGTAAPWRRNRSRATSAVPGSQPGISTQGHSTKHVDENLLLLKNVDESLSLLKKADENLLKKEARSVEVKTVAEVNSLASTPFSICQLMTPIIPSRQATDTSEILSVLSPSSLDLPLQPQSEAKVTPEPPLKRDSYKSLASSILFNLKDNRKRVKSRYSPPKFKTLEESEGGSPQSDQVKQAFSEGLASGTSTPVLVKDAAAVCSPLSEMNTQSVDLAQSPLSDDYLLSNLLQSKREAEASQMSPLIHAKKNKSPLAKKQNYPSLNLYKKASPVDSGMKYLQVPLSLGASVHTESEKIYLSPPPLDKEFTPTPLPKTAGLSPDTLNVSKSLSTVIPSPAFVKEGPTLQGKVVKKPPDVPEKAKRKNSMEAVSLKEHYVTNQPISAVTVMKAAREAINAAKTKASSAAEATNRPTDGTDREEEKEEKSQVFAASSNEENTTDNINSDKKKEPPPVPKRNFTKSDIQLPLDSAGRLSNGDPENSKEPKSKESSQRQGKLKHIFSARQNNYIKNQRYALSDDEQEGGAEESDLNVSASEQDENEPVARREMRDSEHIISDLNALKELERARLADRIQENAKNKSGVVDIVEQTKARNDLISRELRNIKKGMMSMRGNAMAKREKFAKKENEQCKGEVYTKIDGNVIVNKAVINDNYDKAKMALEEIISERERRKNVTEQEAVSDESYDKFQKHKGTVDTEADVESTDPSLTDLKERLGDLRDHNHMRQILSQTEPGLGETHRAGGRVALPGMDRTSNELNALLKVKSNTNETLINNYLDDSRQVYSSHVPEDTLEMTVDQNKDRKQNAPPVPPRSRKGGCRRDSVTKETDLTNDVVEEDNKSDQWDFCLRSETKAISSGKQKVKESNETVPSESKTNLDKAINANSKATKSSDSVPSESLVTKSSQLENRLYLSPEARTNEHKTDTMSPMTEVAPESNIQTKGTGKVKRKAPLRPDHVNSPVPDKPNKTIAANEDSKLDLDFLVESPRLIISPLLLVNGQSPPDQASLSSKSSYFSAESALHRNTETESNVYHSLENLIGEVEEVDEVRNASQNTKNDSERTETEYDSFSDHESEPEPAKRQIKPPQKEPETLCKEAKETDKSTEESKVTDKKKDPTATSNPVSPTLAIPALFKVKDNTFSNKLKKIRQPWSPRGSLAGVESLGLDQLNKNLEPTVSHQSHSNDITTVPSEGRKEVEVEISPKSSSPLLILPTSPPSEKLKVQQDEGFLTVPQQEDRNSGVSPLSEGVESTATSTVDTGDETGMNSGIELEVSKVPSERSGSTCSGNDSQTGLTKPPVVLPKSEKAVLKAMKLTNRRIKKEEAQKSAHKTSHSSGKHKSDRHKSDKSLHKSTSSGRNPKSSERKHRERTDTSHHNVEENTTDLSHDNQQRADLSQTNWRPSVDSGEHTSHRNRTALANERQGRSSDRQVRDRPDQRHYSSDRIISNVPVYKAHVEEKPRSDRLFHRSLSTDRYTENKVERRLSADVSVNDRPDLRSQRIEKSIMDEFQQRGRQRDKPSKDNPLRRSHSIDSQSANVLHPANLSRQSSLTSQLSRQSSIEHTIVTQSFPIAQRKLLQDPDSGQYFFVDMPVQVKTKTFFDPQTGSYVQLPVQPPEGALPQASPMEVLSPPLVVYHGFVPVPLSPMAQKAPIQAPRIEREDFDPRHLERVLTRHTDGHSSMEPVFGQHEHMLGEFLGTEELDCPS